MKGFVIYYKGSQVNLDNSNSSFNEKVIHFSNSSRSEATSLQFCSRQIFPVWLIHSCSGGFPTNNGLEQSTWHNKDGHASSPTVFSNVHVKSLTAFIYRTEAYQNMFLGSYHLSTGGGISLMFPLISG